MSTVASTYATIVAQAVVGKVPNSRGWIRINCPLCELRQGAPDRKTSFGFNVERLYYECYRCGAGGRLREAPEDYEGRYELTPEEQAPGIDGPPDGFMFLCEEPAASSLACVPAWDYLLAAPPHGRGLTEEQVASAQLGVCLEGRFAGRVIVPIFDTDGEWVWYVGRTWVKKSPKPYLYPKGGRHGVIYNHAALFEHTEEPAIIVEGCFDAIPYAPDACALLGKTTEDHVAALASANRPIAMVLDGDAHEEGWAVMMKLRLAGQRAGSVKLPPRVDPDELPREALRAAARAAIEEGEVTFNEERFGS